MIFTHNVCNKTGVVSDSYFLFLIYSLIALQNIKMRLFAYSSASVTPKYNFSPSPCTFISHSN